MSPGEIRGLHRGLHAPRIHALSGTRVARNHAKSA
jgi:hypothetical protein